jgi:hypothetical protein
VSDVHRHYLRDLGYLLKEMAVEAQREHVASQADEFKSGRAIALYEVLSLLQNQAVAFQLPLNDLALEGFDADRDLLKYGRPDDHGD